ncbi:MAG: octaprenyl diphosphate synthase [Gammaproteobacteria bacterium]|nr:octaprenyl diphosphate synthase [Gammaproteobacteria bacterium]
MPATTALSPEDIRALAAADLRAVDERILRSLQSEVVLINEVARYIIGGGGKRLRPTLVLLSAGAYGYEGEHHLEMAAIIEFIHTATLLHDDVVDASAMRRGKDTANMVWGNEASVLVGDFLYSRAFQLMVRAGSMRAMEIFAETTNVIAEGEVLQLLSIHEPATTEEQYLAVIRAKTAKLFEASARLGPVLTGYGRQMEELMAEYGRHLGTAYQLVDDVLDYRGDAQAIGKNVGDDLAEGKPTLPLIYTMRHGTPAQAKVIKNAIKNGGRDAIDEVVTIVESTGAIEYTTAFAQAEAERAADALEGIPDSPFTDALRGLAHFAVDRSS